MKDRLIAFISDIHWPTEDKAKYALSRKILKDVKPDILVLGGDCADPTAVSHWTTDPRKRLEFMYQVKYWRNQLAILAEEHPNATKFYLEGNHELHLYKFLERSAAELRDFDELQLPVLLRLAQHDYRYLDSNTPLQAGKLILLHGHQFKLSGATINVARSVFFRMMRNTMIGHWHRFQCYRQPVHEGSSLAVWVNGTLQDRHQIDYDFFPHWQYGFSLISVSKSGNFHVDQIEIFEDPLKVWAMTNGKYYEVKKKEPEREVLAI